VFKNAVADYSLQLRLESFILLRGQFPHAIDVTKLMMGYIKFITSHQGMSHRGHWQPVHSAHQWDPHFQRVSVRQARVPCAQAMYEYFSPLKQSIRYTRADSWLDFV
jgi:hypothetical protein